MHRHQALPALDPDVLMGWLGQLRPDHELILRLRFESKLDLEEIGSALNMRMDAVRVLQLRALQELREVLEQSRDRGEACGAYSRNRTRIHGRLSVRL
jgi:DNA-directed RNA polymerase specialized sigma24 family protein